LGPDGTFKKEVLAAVGLQEGFGQSGGLESEIEKTCPRDLNWLAPGADVKLSDHAGGDLAGIESARLGQGHQPGRLIIAKARIGARPDEKTGQISVRKNGADGELKPLFNESMR